MTIKVTLKTVFSTLKVLFCQTKNSANYLQSLSNV